MAAKNNVVTVLKFCSLYKAKGWITKNRIAVSTKSGNIVLYLRKEMAKSLSIWGCLILPTPSSAGAKQEKTYIIRDNEQTFLSVRYRWGIRIA